MKNDAAGAAVKLRIEEFAMKRLRDIQGLLGGDVLRVKSELAKHCTDITLSTGGALRPIRTGHGRG